MEDSGGARNARSFYTQRLRRPRGIVRARGGAHLHLRSRCACSLSSSLFFFLSSNVSRWLREQSVTLWTRGLKWRAGNVRKLAERTNERTNERKNRPSVRFTLVFRGKNKNRKRKVLLSVGWCCANNGCEVSVPYFSSVYRRFPRKEDNERRESSEQSAVVSPKWLIASPRRAFSLASIDSRFTEEAPDQPVSCFVNRLTLRPWDSRTTWRLSNWRNWRESERVRSK